MRHNPERLAWTVLLASFGMCVALTISVPLTVRWWIDTAYVGLEVACSVQQGTLQLTCGDGAVPIAVTERMEGVCQGVESMTVLTLSGDQGLLTLRTRGVSPQPLAEILVGNDTQLKIVHARAPRFAISSQPYVLDLHLESGRARVSAGEPPARPLRVQVDTPEALVQMSQGSASVQVGPGETRVGVYEGAALVFWNDRGEGINLERLQSAVLPPPGGVLQALPPAQNLLVGGEFGASLEPAWQTYSKDVEFAGESGGQVVSGASGVVGFTRFGRGHAETGIVQTIQRDVQNARSLQLRLVLRVLEQDVPVCGTRGTECPIMVKIEYEDAAGELRSWLQGFYASLDPNRLNPPFCTICSPRADHLRVEPGQWYAYDSPNLVPLLSQAGPPPLRILSLTLYASGHTYRSEVARVELLAQDGWR